MMQLLAKRCVVTCFAMLLIVCPHERVCNRNSRSFGLTTALFQKSLQESPRTFRNHLLSPHRALQGFPVEASRTIISMGLCVRATQSNPFFRLVMGLLHGLSGTVMSFQDVWAHYFQASQVKLSLNLSSKLTTAPSATSSQLPQEWIPTVL